MLLMKITMYKKIVLIFTLSGIFLLSGCGGDTTKKVEKPLDYTNTTETPQHKFTIEKIEIKRRNDPQIISLSHNVKMALGDDNKTLYLEIPTQNKKIQIEFNAATVKSYYLLKSGKIDDKTSAVIFKMTLVTDLPIDPIVKDYLKLNELGYLILSDDKNIPLILSNP